MFRSTKEWTPCTIYNIGRSIIGFISDTATDLVISKVDVLEEYGIFKLYYDKSLYTFQNIYAMKNFIEKKIKNKCLMLERIIFSGDPETVDNLIMSTNNISS